MCIKYGILCLSVIFTFNAMAQQDASTPTTKLKALIIDGQNNHDQWPKITYMLKQYLEETGLFKADVKRTAYTWKGEAYLTDFAIEGIPDTEILDKPKADPSYSPDFSNYDVVICNFGWNAAPWPKETQKSFEAYMNNGGGLVVFHAADNSFPEWPAYNLMIGLGGWGDRSEKDGPYVYYNDTDELIRDMTPGNAGAHGPQHEYQIQLRNTEHPITKGMPEKWLHTKDELYQQLRGPAENMEVLATAYAAEEQDGSGRHEPAMMVLHYGKGRIFHSILGHADYSVQCVGFITTILRSAEWAATGKVTIPIPSDFPTADQSNIRDFKIE
ncbi:MAG: ThuA domain-containing protein [Maribacter sp.]|uniref:ThuA domain-containing protein n=1 Tax=Maribacter sp. TaxID=1897614 RepID=UPI003C7076C8